jgi:hypothetical protein
MIYLEVPHDTTTITRYIYYPTSVSIVAVRVFLQTAYLGRLPKGDRPCRPRGDDQDASLACGHPKRRALPPSSVIG